MADHKKFFIRVFGQAVPVTQDVYNAYYRMHRRERYLPR